jgi:hypothetical protein
MSVGEISWCDGDGSSDCRAGCYGLPLLGHAPKIGQWTYGYSRDKIFDLGRGSHVGLRSLWAGLMGSGVCE